MASLNVLHAIDSSVGVGVMSRKKSGFGVKARSRIGLQAGSCLADHDRMYLTTGAGGGAGCTGGSTGGPSSARARRTCDHHIKTPMLEAIELHTLCFEVNEPMKLHTFCLTNKCYQSNDDTNTVSGAPADRTPAARRRRYRSQAHSQTPPAARTPRTLAQGAARSPPACTTICQVRISLRDGAA